MRDPGVYEVKWDEHGLAIDWEVVPAHIGPTWSKDPNWNGPRDPNGYILPKLTLGYQVIKWITDNLRSDSVDFNDNRLPFKLSPEQARFVLWFYEIDENGVFVSREVVMQRLKGHGKDPLAAILSAVEFVGPCRFAGWATEDMSDHGILTGDPYAIPAVRATVQIAAVSKNQTDNTFALFHGLFSEECKAEHGIEIFKGVAYAYGGLKKMMGVTSNPRALEGNRPTMVVGNEPHQWVASNDGLEMFNVITRNAGKVDARVLWLTNAYEPSENSVGKNIRQSYEDEAAGLTEPTGLRYDSLEAPPDALLAPRMDQAVVERIGRQKASDLVRLYIRRVLEAVRGDSLWVPIKTTTNLILDKRNAPSTSRRFYYNQITAAEDAWLNPLAIKLAIDPMAAEQRRQNLSDAREILEAGWLVAASEPIVMFLDCSKSDDSTALVGCRLRDGYVFTIGVWQKPRGKRGETWLVDRQAVSARVREAFDLFNVVAFWGDPSHAKDDGDSTRYWDGMFDSWMQTYRDRLDSRYWPMKSGHRKHAIMFDMAGPDQQKLFVAAAEEFVESMESLNDIEEFAPSFTHDGHPALIDHMQNAIRNTSNPWGVSLMKVNRESAKKIDLAVCAVGARMLRRVVANTGLEDKESDEGWEIWGY